MDIDQLLKTRRTIKPQNFKPDPVDDTLITEMLETANWAPTHGFTEPWRFFVFAGQGNKTLGNFHASLYKRETPADQYKEKKYNQLIERPQLASHTILIGMKRGNNPKIPEIEEIEATACAVQNMWLSAAAKGLGAYWSSGGLTYHEKMKQFVGLGPEDYILGFFFIGYPAIEWPKSKRVTDIKEKVHWFKS